MPPTLVDAVHILGVAVLAFYALWVFFIVVMALRDKRDAGDAWTALDKIFGYPTVIAGYVLDVALNATVATVLYAEVPQEWTLSARSTRHARAKMDAPDWLDRWRTGLAQWTLRSIGWYDRTGGHTA